MYVFKYTSMFVYMHPKTSAWNLLFHDHDQVGHFLCQRACFSFFGEMYLVVAVSRAALSEV